MRFKKLFLTSLSAILLGVFSSGTAHANAEAVYLSPTNRMGAALAEGITMTLIRRGYAMYDPRIFDTIKAISARTAATVASSGMTWLGYLGRLSPWIATGILIYGGYKWYVNGDGTIKTEILIDPAKVGGIVQGGAYWVSTGIYGSDPYAVGLQSVIPSSAGWTVWSFSFSGTDTLNGYNRNKYTYTLQHPSYCVNGGCQSNTVYVEQHPTGAPGTCNSGTYFKNGAGCVAYNFKLTNGNTGQSTTGQTYQQAYDALPQTVKDSALSPEMAAELANRAWRDAATQPDYAGVPWSSAQPTTKDDFTPYQTAHPSDWPKNSELPSAIPTPGSIVSPETNPNQISSPSTAIKVDLGGDPGISEPVLGVPPTDLMKPIKDVVNPWLNWTPPSHSATCPSWHVTPSIAGHAFDIDLSYHCTFIEQYRAMISVAAMTTWLVIALFIILSA